MAIYLNPDCVGSKKDFFETAAVARPEALERIHGKLDEMLKTNEPDEQNRFIVLIVDNRIFDAALVVDTIAEGRSQIWELENEPSRQSKIHGYICHRSWIEDVDPDAAKVLPRRT